MKEKKYPRVKCENCKGMFSQKRKWQRFCCGQCRWENWDKTNPRIKEGV